MTSARSGAGAGAGGPATASAATGAAGAAEHPRLSPEALELVAARFKALSDPTRLALLNALFAGERTVQALCEETGVGQANASKHLAVLAEQGIVARRREGSFVHYRLDDPTIHDLCRLVCGALAERFEAARASLRPPG